MNKQFIHLFSPKSCRGSVNVITVVFMNLGCTLSSAIAALAVILECGKFWWLIYAIEAFLLIIVLILLPVLHESPEYVIKKNIK